MSTYYRGSTAAPVPTSIKDRTKEFRAAIDLVRRRSRAVSPTPSISTSDPTVSSSTPAPAPYQPRSEFTRLASNIGRDIQATTRRLERLGVLAKRRTLFDDKPEEIATLTQAVKQDIALINQKIAALQRFSNDQRNRQPASTQAKEHNTNVVVFLQSKLANTSMSFKNILEVRSENIKASNSRREQFMDPASKSGAAASPTDNSPLYLTQRRQPYQAVDDSEDFVSLSVPDSSDPHHGSQELLLMEQNDQYVDSRSTAIQSIESTIAELGGIFQQLAHMVAEQRDVVQRIDANVEDIEMNVVGAQQELLKYYSYVSSNRWLMLKIFAVIIIFVTLFILVM